MMADQPVDVPLPSDEATPPLTARGVFDHVFYLATHSDLHDVGMDAWDHYDRFGWREGRDPTNWFSTKDYLAANADVAAADVNPFDHYIVAGRAEGRRLTPGNPQEDATSIAPDSLAAVVEAFDPDFYNAVYSDIDLSAEDAFTHYLHTGWREGRDPSRWFSTRGYLDANLDVEATGVNPFVHYMLNGRAEGRALTHSLGFRFDLVRRSASFEDFVQASLAAPDPRPEGPERLRLALSGAEARDRLHLTLSHDDYTTNVGGVQLCITLEAGKLKEVGVAHIHLFPAAPGAVVDVHRTDAAIGVLLDGDFLGYFKTDDIVEAVGTAFGQGQITAAIHSLIGFRADAVIGILRELEVSRTYYWLHDFSSLCANFNLMRNDAVFCGAPPAESLACEICAYGARRQIQLEAHLNLFDALHPVVVAPSESALSIWRRAFPYKDVEAVVHPHARFLGKPRVVESPLAAAEELARPLRVGFLGMPTSHKGWPVFVELARGFADDARYSFHHLSKHGDPAVPAEWVQVSPTAQNAVPMIEAVSRCELDVALIWSLWPETFCFAAYEAVAGGAAVITNNDAGNVRDLVIAERCGLVLSGEDALSRLFSSGDACRLRRPPSLHTLPLGYSGMTADLLGIELS